ncbi:GNAT family N-acetyltransferase [Cellulomonas chitinilytica]|nr:GNAT family N-acetyltransferase [Cellulomonas chitinilytica]
MSGRLQTWTGAVPAVARAQVAELLEDAVAGPHPETASALVASLPAVVVCVDDEPVAAAVGRERDGGFVVRALAVERTRRRSGLGRLLLDEVSLVSGYRWVEAETDRHSVEFYRRCGFSITSLGEKYPGVERFRCLRESPDQPSRRPTDGRL